ncbi:T9SS type A sorting domain-containing protein [Polaribacter reichenbachii]|nr:T9SS type A sorting domain-containing protein [Polaribacter reichenbachii]
MKKSIFLYCLFTLFCFKLTSQTLVWDNKPSSLDFELGSALSMNLTYNTNGNSFNYIWIKLQRRSVTNSILEEFDGVFYTGSNPVASQDTVNLTYSLPNNIPLSSELVNGEYYQLFTAMWSGTSTWTGLDLLLNIVEENGVVNTTGNTKVVATLNTKHIVGEIESFDRSKFITIHSNQADNEWNGANSIADVRDDFLNGYDVFMGRDTGGITWHLSQLEEDPTRTGFANPSAITSRAPYWRGVYQNKNIQQYEARNNLIIAAQHHPFWTGNGQKNTGKGWQFANATAVGEYMGRYINEFHKDNGEPKPKFIEVMNEPAYADYGGPSDFTNDIQDISDFHNDVADAIKVQIPDAKVGGYTTAFPNFEKGDFERWHKRWKLFMDVAGEKMDFWSIHLYDFPSIGGKKQFRSGSNLEATFDMMEQYSMMKFGKVKPFVISEYGAQTHDYNNQEWSAYRDWLHVRSSNSMLPSFMDRPNLIASTINFIIAKAEWGYTSVPYVHRLLRKENEPNSYTGDWIYTDMIKFYQLWADVKGTRIDTYSDNLDIQVDGYLDGDKFYLMMNNLTFNDEIIDLSFLNSGNSTITAINKKHSYVNGLTPVLEDESLAIDVSSVTLKSEGTMILEITFNNPISVSQTNTEKKYYATTYLKEIAQNQENTFQINNVTTANYGEVVLRIGVGRLHNLSLKPIVKVNNRSITVPDNWRGDDQKDRERFFGVLEIPVPYDLLQTNNAISVEFPDSGGHISTVTMQVYNFSSDIRNSTLSVIEHPTKNLIKVYPNPTKGIIKIENGLSYNQLTIYDLRGVKVASFGKDQVIDISQFTAGVYYLKTDNGAICKIVKE